ncbi:alpha/beta fold hydrolase [Aliikangiella sp. IMCC44359]|uniref:alpha/beta fold hydrolase n=1 Tax=Aliikangiella sp. IMCC44359 TaxID=3459125 RepID=UPI00403ACA21
MELVVKNGQLYYESYGQGDCIIFLNGFASGISNWYPIIRDLKRQYHCVLFDYVGTGESINEPDYEFSLDSYAADLNALMEMIGVESAHIVGYSMGGWNAQYFSQIYPEKVKSLTLINSSSKIFERQNWIISHFITVLRDSEINVFSQLMFISYYSPEFFEKNAEYLERLKKLAVLTFEKQDNANWEKVLQSCLPFNAEEHLKTLATPTLVISGEHDVLCPRLTAQRFKELIANLQWEEYASVGHAIPMECSKQLRISLNDFLEKL